MARLHGVLRAGVVFAVWLLVGVAHAGDGSSCAVSLEEYPSAGATGVPQNPMIIVVATNRDYLNLGDRDIDDELPVVELGSVEGPLMELEAEFLLDSCAPVFRVDEDLEANTEYSVLVDRIVAQSFTTALGLDEDSPSLTVGADDPDSPGLQADVELGGDVVALTYEARKDDGITYIAVTPDGDAALDIAGDYENGDTIVVTAWDRAGNSSDVTVRVAGVSGENSGDDTSEAGSSSDAGSEGSGCQIGPGPLSSSDWAASGWSVLALLLRARRRGRR